MRRSPNHAVVRRSARSIEGIIDTSQCGYTFDARQLSHQGRRYDPDSQRCYNMNLQPLLIPLNETSQVRTSAAFYLIHPTAIARLANRLDRH